MNSSGDRAAHFTIESDDPGDLIRRHVIANARIQATDLQGNDLLRHDLAKPW